MIETEVVNRMEMRMLTVYCPVCEWEIETNDTDGEVICPQCGRLFTIDSGDACYSNKNKGK